MFSFTKAAQVNKASFVLFKAGTFLSQSVIKSLSGRVLSIILTMDTAHKPKNHKNFYIEFDDPPNSLYTDGDIIAGRCVLLSTRDEDVGVITLSFHGIVKTHVEHHNYSQGSQVQEVNYNSESVLFQEKKVLYQGTYTLRKNVQYEWPFNFELPRNLPPSGAFGKGNYGNGQIAYELEAARTRTWQDPTTIERQMDPRNDLKGAPFQPSGLFKKLGTFTGMIAAASICVLPPRPKRVNTSLFSCKVECQLPSRSPSQSSGTHHKLSGMFRSHPNNGSINSSIVLIFPTSLVHCKPINTLLQVVSEETAALPPIFLQSVDMHLRCYTTIKSDSRSHQNQHESKISLLNQSKSNISMTHNSCLDLGSLFNLQLDPNIVPSFSRPLIQVQYDLRAHITLEAGGKKIKEDFLVENVQVMSSRTATSPLNRDYLCTFVPEIRRSTFEPSPMVYPGREREAETEVGNAYLALSRLLTENAISNNPVSVESGNLTIFLHRRMGSLVPRQSAQSASNTPPSAVPVESIKDPAVADQELFDTILGGHAGFRATGLSKQESLDTVVDVAKMVFIWHNQTLLTENAAAEDRACEIYVRIEISGIFVLQFSSPSSNADIA